MYCNVLQYATVCCSVCCTCEWGRVFQCNAVCRNAMQCLAVCLVLRVLQCVLHLWMRILAPPKAVRFSCWVPWPNLSLTSTSSPRQETLKRNLPKRCLETKRALQIWLFFFLLQAITTKETCKRDQPKNWRKDEDTLFFRMSERLEISFQTSFPLRDSISGSPIRPRMEKLHCGQARVQLNVNIMFHRNETCSIIRFSCSILYSLVYFNSRLGSNVLKQNICTKKSQ